MDADWGELGERLISSTLGLRVSTMFMDGSAALPFSDSHPTKSSTLEFSERTPGQRQRCFWFACFNQSAGLTAWNVGLEVEKCVDATRLTRTEDERWGNLHVDQGFSVCNTHNLHP